MIKMTKCNDVEYFRNAEKMFRDLADATAKCAEIYEKEDATESECEEALKNLMWGLAKLKMLE